MEDGRDIGLTHRGTNAVQIPPRLFFGGTGRRFSRAMVHDDVGQLVVCRGGDLDVIHASVNRGVRVGRNLRVNGAHARLRRNRCSTVHALERLRIVIERPIETANVLARADPLPRGQNATSGTVAGRDSPRRREWDAWRYRVDRATPLAAFAISAATAFGWDT
jgi:hypothetical protein